MKKSTKIIIAVVSLLVIAAAVFAVLYFATDLFKAKNPKKAFEEYLNEAIAPKEGGASYGDMIASLKKAQTEPVAGKGSLSMDVELGSQLSDDETDAVVELLNNIDISFETKANPKDTSSYTSMNVKYAGKDLGTIELVANEEEVGVKFAEVYDKYFTMTMEEMMEAMDIDMSDLEAVMEDVDVDELISILEISDEEISRIANRYKDVLLETIPEDNYSSEKEKITVNGEEIEATAYVVKISDKDLVKLAKAMLESLAEDDETIKLVVDKANKISEFAGESMTLSNANVKALLESAIESLDGVDELTGEKMEIKVYEYKKETVRVAFEVEDDAIIIDTRTKDDVTNMAIKMKADGEEMTLLNMEQTKKGDNAYTTKLSTDIEGVKLEITADTEITDSREKVDMKLYVEVPSMIKATLNMNMEAEYTSVNIDKLSSSNSVAISDLTEEDATEVMEGLLGYIEDKMDVIKEIATVLGYEDEIEEFEKTLETYNAADTLDVDEDVDTDVETEVDEDVDAETEEVEDEEEAA